MFAGLNGLLSALDDEPNGPAAPPTGPGDALPPPPEDGGERGGEPGDAAAAGFELGGQVWGFAKGLVKDVRQQSTEILKSVKDADWAQDLKEFGDELAKDTSELVIAPTGELVGEVGELLQKAGRSRRGSRAEEGEEAALTMQDLGKGFLTGTSELFNQVKEAVHQEMRVFDDRAGAAPASAGPPPRASQTALKRSSKFQTLVSTMQRDSSTYCDEPEDEEDFDLWQATFDLDGHGRAVQDILKENAFMAELHARIVPVIVEHEDFWTRYFYRLYCLEVQEGLRDPVKRPAEPALPVAEPAAEPEAEPAAEPAVAPAAEPAVEPAVAPAVAPARAPEPAAASPLSASENDGDVESNEEAGSSEDLSPVAGPSRTVHSESELEAATASDSSAAEWLEIKQRRQAPPPPTKRESPAEPAPVEEDAAADSLTNTPAKAEGEGSDDDIDEDWGEI